MVQMDPTFCALTFQVIGKSAFGDDFAQRVTEIQGRTYRLLDLAARFSYTFANQFTNKLYLLFPNLYMKLPLPVPKEWSFTT